MTETILRSALKEITIGFDKPFCVIGERINPTGRKLLAEEMSNEEFARVRSDAIAQVKAVAMMLDVNAGIPLTDEPKLLATAIKVVQSVTDVPLVIDSSIIGALEAGLKVYEGIYFKGNKRTFAIENKLVINKSDFQSSLNKNIWDNNLISVNSYSYFNCKQKN